MRCTSCRGVWHPSTGSLLGRGTCLCLRCTLDFIAWLKLREGAMGARIKKHGGAPSFTECALTSIGAKRLSAPMGAYSKALARP